MRHWLNVHNEGKYMKFTHIITCISRTVNQAEISVHKVLQINGHHTLLCYNLELQQWCC